VLIGWQYFFNIPQMKAAAPSRPRASFLSRRRSLAAPANPQTGAAIRRPPRPGHHNPALPHARRPPPAVVSREVAISASPAIKIEPASSAAASR
jgi:YidC/Oxa1 family membrane protein insertase